MDNAAYPHDGRADKRHYRHDRREDSQCRDHNENQLSNTIRPKNVLFKPRIASVVFESHFCAFGRVMALQSFHWLILNVKRKKEMDFHCHKQENLFRLCDFGFMLYAYFGSSLTSLM